MRYAIVTTMLAALTGCANLTHHIDTSRPDDGPLAHTESEVLGVDEDTGEIIYADEPNPPDLPPQFYAGAGVQFGDAELDYDGLFNPEIVEDETDLMGGKIVLGARPIKYLAVETTFDYAEFDTLGNEFFSGIDHYDIDTLSWMIRARPTLPIGHFEIYGLAGAGISYVDVDVSNAVGLSDEDEFAWALEGGAGLEWQFGRTISVVPKGWALFLEGVYRETILSSDFEDDTGISDLETVTATVGLKYNW